ncbi:uncharacterized protein [Nothobranchius furzeri]|uniref:Uncharacterized protein n=2 Tax=Nothobranchius TaxID=28779 RepID=A0A1A8A4D1_NOTFU|nr:uncharacterized protein si:ch211-214p13.7 isoform X1 [Nothobranchius furzeri]
MQTVRPEAAGATGFRLSSNNQELSWESSWETAPPGNSAAANDDQEPNEDVMYASISHSNSKGPRPQAMADNDCDYATVHIPANIQADAKSNSSSKDECADDYVLME